MRHRANGRSGHDVAKVIGAQAGTAIAGKGELGRFVESFWPPRLFSLPRLLLLLFSLLWLFDVGKLGSPAPISESSFFAFGARHD